MPYKDKNKAKINIKKWKEKNKESYSIKQKKYQNNHRDKKYIEHINILRPLSKSDKIKYLSNFHGNTILSIMKRLPNNQQKEYKQLLNIISENKDRKWQQKNQQKNQQKRKERKKKRYNILIQYKKNNPCEHCGENNYLKLSFHHIDKKNKSYPGKEMSRITSYSLEVLKAEIQKCIILCHNCHHILHYNNYKENLLNRYNRLWEKQRTRQQWKYIYRYKNKYLLLLYKETLKCYKCGESNDRCLVFHHINYKTKKNRISKLETMKSINIELSKCICLCRNCHEEYHQTYGKSFSNKKDLEKYLEFAPIFLSVDISIYKDQFYKELLEFQERNIKYDLGPIFS